MRLIVLGIALCLILAAPVDAAEYAIAMARHAWTSDQRVEFTLIAVDAASDLAAAGFSDHVTGELRSGRRTYTVTARRIDQDAAAAGRSVDRARYGFSLPQEITGPVQLKILNATVPTVRFTVEAPAETLAGDPSYPTLDSLYTLYQPYIGNIGAYKPMYFLAGTDLSKSKFQISFNYRFFNPESDLSERHPWVKGFHFGYTQTSFWDLGSSSAPFEDNSYKPELFWVSKNVISARSAVKGLFFQTGLQHESNGQGGDDSRSTNFLYLQPIFIFFSETNRYGIQVAPKIWTYVNNDNETNPDLDQFKGYFDLELKIGKMDNLVLGSSFRWAAEGASIQLDLTYPLHRFLFNTLDIYLQAQYTNALAESLIDYRERTHAFRLGFSIVR